MRRLIESAGQASSFLVEPMTEVDLPEVVCVEEISGLSRWGFAAYQRELRENDLAIMLVARPAGRSWSAHRVVGFLCSSIIMDEWHINNVATRPEFRRRGIARELLLEGLASARYRGARFSLLEVRATNLAAQALYLHLGFHVVSRRPRYYANPTEDAMVLRMDLREAARRRVFENF